VRKVRGITLNYNASKMVNFEVIRDMILRGNKGNEPPLHMYIQTRKLNARKQEVQP